MPRKARIEVEPGVYHVYARGNNRERVFFDESDRRLYLRLLGHTVRRARWHCLSYCLMDNHVHLLIETEQPTLGYGMQRLHGDYARALNDRRERSGHVFQGRYGARAVTGTEQLWATVRYIALNPSEAGLGDRMQDWRWSSHAVILGGPGPAWVDVPRLLSLFGSAGGEPLRRYTELIA